MFLSRSKNLALSVPTLFFASSYVCPSVGEAAIFSERPSYADVAAIVGDYCEPCHNSDFGYADIKLDTEASLNLFRERAFQSVANGIMPLGDPNFKNTPAGQKLLEYLQAAPAE